MTQFSLAPLDPLAMEDDVALASHDLKQCADVVVSSPRDGTPMEDNQELHEEEDAAVESDVQPTPTTNQRQATKRVTFVDADIVEFEPTIWTATIASDGVPVGLSSNVRRRTRRRLDSYEGERLLHRINRQEYMEHGYLEPDERLEMLEAAGHSIAIINHVERETVRLNRERWESNEYDLLYQFGLGEPAIMDLDEDEELLLSQGTLLGFNTPTQSKPASFYQPVYDDDDDEMLEVTGDDDEGNPAEYYYYSGGRKPDVDVGFAMDEIDSYDTRKYEEWAWDYTTDGILSGDDQFGKNAFDLPSLDFGLPELSSSPTDVSTSNDCMVVSCGKIIGVGSPSSTQSKSLTSQHSPSTGAFV